MYSPTLGRWMQQDPAGYVDGMNSYASYRADPLRWLDPGGTAVIILQAGGSAPATTKPVTDLLDQYKTNLDAAIKAFKTLPEATFKEIQKAGNVLWDGEKFAGEYADFLALMEREKSESELIFYNRGNAEGFKKALAELVKKNVKTWDYTVAAAHGIYDHDTGQPLNLIDVNGDTVEQGKYIGELDDLLKGVKGKGFVVSCFNNPEGREELVVQDGSYGLKQHANDPDPSKCAVSFLPLKVKKDLGPKPKPASQPGQP